MTKILTLDNDPETQNLFSTILEVAGFELVRATDGNQAWRSLSDGSVDLFIFDVKVDLRPGSRGQGIYDQIKSEPKLSQIPILVLRDDDLTGDDFQEEINTEKRDLTLAKPFSEKALLTTIVALLQHYGKPVPSGKQRSAQFHKARHRLRKQFSRRSDKSLRSDHKRYSRIINRHLR